jgi:hypothetical protein
MKKTVIQQQKLVITAERLAAAEKRYCNNVEGCLAGEVFTGTVHRTAVKVSFINADFHGLCSFHVRRLFAMFAPRRGERLAMTYRAVLLYP